MASWVRRTGPAAAPVAGLGGCGLLALVLCAAPAAAQAPAAASVQPGAVQASLESPPASDASTWRAVLDRYCVTCHNERLLTGNLALDDVDVEHVGADAEVWEKVLQKLRTQAMPPPRRPRPDAGTYGGFAAWLETALDRAAADRPNPGRPTIHRLNRLEYTNAIRDLLDLEIDSATMLPADDLAYGFDNNADILTVAPGLLERYMSAARRISRLAVGDPTIEADAVRYPLSSLLVQDDRMSEDLPFGSRGGAAVRHHFPLDGEYLVRIGLQGSGRREPQEIDVRVDGVRRALLRVGNWPEGADPGAARVVEPGEPLLVRFPARAGTHVVSVSFAKRTAVTEGMAPSRLPIWTFSTGRGYVQRMALESVEIEGPFSPDTIGRGPDGEGEAASRRRIFVCRPATAEEEEPCADEILGTLARRAFRRPVDEIDLEVLRGFYAEGRAEGNFDAGIQRALESMLVDPEFLFRIERDPAGIDPATPYRLSDVELASRLSFFLWSSLPDDELLDAAEDGSLRDPAVLERQVRRLLADEKAGVLVSSFAAQWLHLRRMRTVTPDVNAFPGFDENLREALVRETELFVESQLRDDRSVVDLLSADYTFVNERLARHYGIPQRLRLPLSPRRPAGRRAPRPARSRQRPDGDVAGHADVAGGARQVGAGEHPRHAAAAAAARRPGPARAGGRRHGHLAARAAGGAPRQPRVLELPCPDGPARLRPRELRRGRQVARHRRCRHAHRSFRHPARRDRLRRLPRPAGHTAGAPRGVRHHGHGEAADLRPRARHGALRPPGHPRHRARGRGERLPLVVADSRRRPEPPVPDEEIGLMIITKKTLPRRTVLRGLGTAVALPLLDGMVPALTALGRTAARPKPPPGVRVRAARRRDAELDPAHRRAPASISRRSSSRWSRSGTTWS